MKIEIDDTFYFIDTEEIDYKMINSFEFREAIQVILTPAQFKKFIEIETNRTFEISEKRYSEFKKYISTSIWRKH